MQMGAGDAAGKAYLSDDLACFYGVAYFGGHRSHVAVEGVDSQAVVEDYGVAGEVERLGQDHASALRGMDWSSSHGAYVHARVGGTGFSVKDAAGTEIFEGRGALDGHAEFALPEFFGGDGGEDGAEAGALVLSEF